MSEISNTTVRRSRSTSLAGRAPLSADGILAAAIKLIDRDGIAAFSMRKLGAALGVQAMSIYHHFPNKDALFIAAATKLTRQLNERRQDDKPALEALRDIMSTTYKLGEEHPAFVSLLFSGVSVPALIERRDADIAALKSMGFTADDAERALLGLIACVTGVLHQATWQDRSHCAATFAFSLDAMLEGLAALAKSRG